jgi:hypothetical protein
MRTYFVYILECADNSFYIGLTNNIKRRVLEHSSGYYVPLALLSFFTQDVPKTTSSSYITNIKKIIQTLVFKENSRNN